MLMSSKDTRYRQIHTVVGTLGGGTTRPGRRRRDMHLHHLEHHLNVSSQRASNLHYFVIALLRQSKGVKEKEATIISFSSFLETSTQLILLLSFKLLRQPLAKREVHRSNGPQTTRHVRQGTQISFVLSSHYPQWNRLLQWKRGNQSVHQQDR
jgi:hypothetical protein